MNKPKGRKYFYIYYLIFFDQFYSVVYLYSHYFLVMWRGVIKLNKSTVGVQIKLMKLTNLLKKIKNRSSIIYYIRYFCQHINELIIIWYRSTFFLKGRAFIKLESYNV